MNNKSKFQNLTKQISLGFFILTTISACSANRNLGSSTGDKPSGATPVVAAPNGSSTGSPSDSTSTPDPFLFYPNGHSSGSTPASSSTSGSSKDQALVPLLSSKVSSDGLSCQAVSLDGSISLAPYLTASDDLCAAYCEKVRRNQEVTGKNCQRGGVPIKTGNLGINPNIIDPAQAVACVARVTVSSGSYDLASGRLGDASECRLFCNSVDYGITNKICISDNQILHDYSMDTSVVPVPAAILPAGTTFAAHPRNLCKVYSNWLDHGFTGTEDTPPTPLPSTSIIWFGGTKEGQCLEACSSFAWLQQNSSPTQCVYRPFNGEDILLGRAGDTHLGALNLVDIPQLSLLSTQKSYISTVVLELNSRALSFPVVDIVQSLAAPIHKDIKVHYQTVSGTALAGVDFLELSGVALLPSGAKNTTFSVELNPSIHGKTFYFDVTYEMDGQQIGSYRLTVTPTGAGI